MLRRVLHRLAVISAVFGTLIAAAPIRAATYFWDSNTGVVGVQDGSGTWSTAGTTWWDPGTNANVAIGNVDIGVFGAGGSGGIVTLSGDQYLNGLVFGELATSGYSFTAGSPTTLKIDAGGILMMSGAQSVTLGDTNLAVLLMAAQTWTNRATNALNVGTIDLGGAPLTLSGIAGVAGTGIFNFQGSMSGSAGLTITNSAVATLTAGGGYSGATWVGNGATLVLSGSAGALTATSGITLSNASLALTNATGESAVDRVNAAPITSNGGTITWTNPSGDNSANWAETLGALSLLKGQTNIVVPNSVNSGRTQVLTLGTGSLTHAPGNTSTTAFAGTNLGGSNNVNNIFITGQATTAANLIIGPWATFGSTTVSQIDYAAYNRNAGTANTRGIQGAGIAATAENLWSTAANSYTLSAATTLTGVRTIASLRYTGAAATLTLGASNFNLATYGILNGGTGTLTIANAAGGTGVVTTPTGGDNTLFLIAGSAAITFSTSTQPAIVANNGTAVNVVKAGSGTVTFGSALVGSGANTYTGATTINTGVLTSGSGVTATFNGGAASWLGASAAAAGNLILNGGTLRYAGPTAGTTDRLFTLGEAGGTIENSGASNGTLAFSATSSIVAAGTGDRTLTLGVNGTGGFTFNPVIVDPTGGGKTSLVITGSAAGAVIIDPTSNNTFTGGITIQSRTLQIRSANGLGGNSIYFGTGTSPVLDLRANAATNFGANGAVLVLGNGTGTVSLSAVSASNAATHTIGAVSIGSGTLNFNRGSNLNTNNSSSLTTGMVTLTGNPTFNLNAGSGSAAPLLNLGGLDDGGVARTVTVAGGAAGTGKQYLRLFNNLTSFTTGTNIVYNGGNLGGIRLDTANSFGTATNPGTIRFATSSTVGGIRLLNNTANTNFATNFVLGDNSMLMDIGGTSASQTSKGLIAGTLSIGTATMTVNGAINTSTNNVYSLMLGATTFTGNATLAVSNTFGTAIGSLTLGALNDGGFARTLTKTGPATLQLNTAATSMIAGTTLTNTQGIVQIGNSTALGSSTLVLGNGTSSGQLVVANGVTLSAATTVTYSGGFSTLTSAVISGPTSGTGTISGTININDVVAADTGHFQGGGGTLNITGPIVTGGTSNGEIIARSGNVTFSNAVGNTYTSLRVNADTLTLGVADAIPSGANVALAETAATTLTLNGFNQTIAAGATWTLGGTGLTLENNVATVNMGTGTLTLNGTLANNMGSLATQLVNGAISFGGSSGTFDIDSGHATSDMTVASSLSNGTLIKEGAGMLTLTGTKSLAALTINNGTVVGGFGTGGVAAVTVGATGSLQMVNSLAEILTLGATPSALNVTGGARLGFELGASGTSDRLVVEVGGTASTSGTITLDFYNLGGLTAGTYTLFTASSGLSAGGTTYNVGSTPLGFNYSIVASDNQVQLITTDYTPRFWTNSQATGSWSTSNAGPLTNWSTNAAGTINSTDTPSSNHTVIFSAINAPLSSGTIGTTLDGPFTIDALQFLAAPTGVTAISIAAGTGGTLTVTPATFSAGIYVDTNAGTATLGAGLAFTANAPQTWNVVGGGANGSALIVAANTVFNASVTKGGAGDLTLSGSNSGSGTLTLSAGTLNINSATALGGGTFVIGGGTTISNGGGSGLILIPNNALTLSGNFTFTGANALNLGSGAIGLPTNVSITTSAGNLTLGGAITESGGVRALTKLGAGTLTLGGNNAFSGGVNLNEGILNINNAGALGAGTFLITAGTIDNTSGSVVVIAGDNSQTWNGNFTFTGTNNLDLGAGAVSLGSATGASRTITVSAGTLAIGGAISNGAVGTGLTKAGLGALTLGGASTYTGNTVLNAGTLNITGSLTGNNATTTLTTGTVLGTTILNIAGNIAMFTIQGGNLDKANSIWNQTAGTVTLNPGAANNNYLANVAGSYGYFNFTGGTYRNPGRFVIANAAGSIAVARVLGTASLDNSGAEYFMISQGGTGELTVLAGGSVDHSGSSQGLHSTLNQSNTFGVLNLAGGTVTTNSLKAGNSSTTVLSGNTSIWNLAGGTLNTSQGFVNSFGGTGTVANVYINFAGATVKSTAAIATLIPAPGASNPQVGVFAVLYGAVNNSAVAGAPSFNGGLSFDSNGFNSAIAQPLIGAHLASGVNQSDLSIAGGSGYVAPPVVQFSTAGLIAGGTPASGYAIVSGGQVTGIVITSPGAYTAGTVPTVTLSGGGGTGAAVTIGALSTANLSAGLTKTGAGMLTLSSANSSFSGSVVISGGTLQVSGMGSFANIGTNSALGSGIATSDATNAASLVLDGGILSIINLGTPTAVNRLFTVTSAGGTLAQDNATAANVVTFNSTAAILYSGSGARTLTLSGVHAGGANINTFAPLIGDAGGDAVTLQKAGATTWLLTNGGNSYKGGTNIAAGVLAFSSGALSSTGIITFTGSSTLRWNGHADDLSARLFITGGVIATVDTDVNNVVFANAVGTTGGTTGVLRKDGGGLLTLNAAAAYTGGTTLNAGTLNIGNASALGSGTFTISGTSTFDNTTGSATTLVGNPQQAWNGNFTFTGTNDLNLGTGAVDMNANRTVTVSAGTLTVGGVVGDAGGDFGLTKAGAGTLYLRGINTFGADDSVSIQGGTLIVDTATGLGANTNNVLFGTAPGTLRFIGNENFDTTQQYFRVTSTAATIQVDAGATVVLAGGLAGGATSGVNSSGTGTSLIKTGLGTLQISGSQAGFGADGGWVVTQGTLSIAGSNLAVLGSSATVSLRLNGGTVSFDTDTTNIVDSGINTFLQASSTVMNNLATSGNGVAQRLNTLTVQGDFTLSLKGGDNVNGGIALFRATGVTLNGNPTFEIINPVNGGTSQLSLSTVIGNSNSITLTGNGDLSQTGVFAGTAPTFLTLDAAYSGLVVMSQSNIFSGATTVNGGVLSFATATNLGDASATNDVNLGGGTLRYSGTAVESLTADRQINLATGTTSTIEVVSDTGTLQAAGGFTTTGAANVVKTGLGTLTVTGPLNLTGGNLTVAAGLVQAGLAATGVGALNIASGATFNLYDGSALSTTLASLTLANGGSLGFDLNASGVNDVVNVTGTQNIAAGSLLNFNNLGGLGVGTYDLLNVSSGTLNAANFSLGIAPSGFNYSLTTVNGNQTLRLMASTLNLIYWQGDVSSSWSDNTAGATNWASDVAGTTDLGRLPVATDTLVFSTTNAVGTSIVTQLNGNFTVDSLRFTSNPTGVTSFLVQNTTGTLTLSPVGSNNGISVAPNAGTIYIGSPLIAATDQTWEVADLRSLVILGNATFTGNVKKTGGGTLELSGVNSGAGGIDLLGGELRFSSAAALGTGTLTIEAGTLLRNFTGNSLTLTTNNTQVWNGSFTFGGSGSQDLNLGTGSATLGNSLTVTPLVQVLTVGGAVDDGTSTYSLRMDGSGVLVFNGNNGYDGLTDLTTGTLTLAGNNIGASGGVTMAALTTLNINHAAALGTGTFTINGGTIDNTTAGVITLSANNTQLWNGSFAFTGTRDLNLGTGDVALGSTPTITVGAKNLTVGGVISGGFGVTKAGAGTLILSGLSSIAANNYDGTTTLDGGTLSITANTAFAGGLTFGAAAAGTNLSNLNLSTADASFDGAMLVQTNSVTNTIVIGSGRTLRFNGAVTIGYSSAANSTTKLSVTGAGALTIGAVGQPTNASVAIGANTTTAFSNAATWDVSGLSTFYANLGTGTFRVGDPTNSAGTAAAGSTLNLAPNSTIIATTITSSSDDSAVTQVIKLGTGTNVFHATTIEVGSGIGIGRTNATLDFLTASGTFTARDLTGTGRVNNFNVVNSATTTGAVPVSTVNLNGHNVDLLIATLTIGARSAGTTGGGTGTFSFNAGTLDATTIVIGSRTGAITTGTLTGTLNIGGGTSTIGTVTMSTNSSTASTTGDAISALNISGGTNTIGTVTMGVNTSAGATGTGSDSNAAINVTGGDTTVNTTFTMGAENSAADAAMTTNNAISALNISAGLLTLANDVNLTMGSTTLDANNTATATISITGTGVLTVGGNIQFTDGLGTESNTVTLTGGTLDMTSGNIGANTSPITLNAQSGILRNLAELNGGGASANATLNKTTSGTLLLDTPNAYTGFTAVTSGVLQITNANALGGSARGTTVSDGAALEISNNIAVSSEALTLSGTGISESGALRSISGNNLYAGNITLAANTTISAEAGSVLTIDVVSGNAFTSAQLVFGFDLGFGGAGNVVVADPIVLGTGKIGVGGSGTVTFAAVNSFDGTTTVSGGTLLLTSGSALGGTSGGTAVNAGGTLALTGDITVPSEPLILDAFLGNATLNNQSGANGWAGSVLVRTRTDANNRAIMNSDEGKLTISGNITIDANFGTQDFVLRGDGDGEISGQITGTQRLFRSSVGTGTWILSGDNSVTFSGKASIANGAIQIFSEANLGAVPGSFVADQLTLGGGSATGTLKTTGDLSLSPNRGVTLAAGGGAFNTAASTALTVNGVIAGSGGLAKEGAGATILTADNTYMGTTTVDAGVLTVNGSIGTSPVAGDVTVNSGAVLNGNGSIQLSAGGTVIAAAGGVQSAGASSSNASYSGHGVGTMTVASTATDAVRWDNGSNLVFDFAVTSTGATTPGATDWDYMNVTGSLNLNKQAGVINLYINAWTSAAGTYGQNAFNPTASIAGQSGAGMDYAYRWKWATATGGIEVDGTAVGLVEQNLGFFHVIDDADNPLYGNGVFSATIGPTPYDRPAGGYFWVSAIGNGLYVNYSQVPEPGSLLLVGIAGLCCAGYRRKQRRRSEEEARPRYANVLQDEDSPDVA